MSKIIYGSLSLIMCILGIVGNSMIIIAVKKKRYLRSTTNYLLLNLAISDLTSLFFLLLMAAGSALVLKNGPLSDFLCKFFIAYHVPFTASLVSILTILVLAIERYFAIVKPMRSGLRLREDNVHFVIIAAWVTGCIVSLPYYVFGSYNGKSKNCSYRNLSHQDQAIFVVVVQIIFVFLPFIITTFCYFQIVRDIYFQNTVRPQNIPARRDAVSRRKLLRLSLSITVAFALCFIPLSITLVMAAFRDESRFGRRYYKYASFLYFGQSALNPLLYAWQSTNFRQAFKELLRTVLPRIEGPRQSHAT
ncbi:somatostatin receptor type 5-like [Exaiptasia diaphana]|uniref:G-protein coupled receptors family 1 profile domain-containing protein n=1 Tax=Exaiptasia diaphana TaxID=2652724 RepID=A0A913XR82_EXADI|nr:somatostatin receptor type 5-like [Exaiptasia diaphana]